MGDMKTPDFDDLLAAFDIPDMVDPKAAIESGQADHECQLKPTNSVTTPQDEPQSAQDGAISVIVKNTRKKENKGHTHSEPHSAVSQKGCLATILSISCDHNQNKWSSPNENGTKSPLFNKYSPISSAEENDEEEDCGDKSGSQSPSGSTSDDNLAKASTQGNVKHDQNNNSQANTDFSISLKDCRSHEELGAIPKPEELKLRKNDKPSEPCCLSNTFAVKNKLSHTLSPCEKAKAVHSLKRPATANTATYNAQEEAVKPILVSPQEDDSPETPATLENSEQSPQLQTKRPDSPSMTTSEGSSNCSPASITANNPVIPKVRIKTIKTKTGQIKRTVTPVSSEHKGIRKAGIFKSQNFIGTTTAILSPPRPSLPMTEVTNSGDLVNDVPKHMTMKPVATAFLPASAVKTVGSQVISLMLADNTTVKATVIPASSMPSTSGALLKGANGIQQQAIMVPSSKVATAKLVPKTVHLGNLNLLPRTMTTSCCDLQQVCSSSQTHQSHLMSKKVSKVQVFGSSQSSLVDAFNKLLGSINPVPVYVPDLSPPSAACITLPCRGYRCLECGDSFALEKSLAQHCERRSVRIEVTCNHCNKSLLFYNKCSLLSHARSHKEKGMVMQCSNLILRPIPTDQMIITTSPVGTQGTDATSHSTRLKRVSQTAAQYMPCSAKAESLEDETSKQDRPNLKCWECNEIFEDVHSLAVHYKQESSSQKTCSICQMILPNQCSFLSHQRIHQHKSPYVCPECGAMFQSVQLQSHHVNRTCLHYTRRSGYRCVHCSVISTDASTLKSHIQSSHCEIFYKCPICPMAFKSAPGTHSHAYTQHPGVKAGEPKLIYKCAMCDTVFTLQSLLYTHLEQHVNTHKVPVFKCPDCSMYYAQKQLMLDHITATHGTLKTAEGPSSLSLPLITRSTNSNSSSANTNHNKDSANEKCHSRPDKYLLAKKASSSQKELKNTSTGYTCGECNMVFTSKETYVGHVRKKHGKILKKHPCHHCEKSFCSMHSLCRHNRLKHKGLHKDLPCPQCPPLSQPFIKRAVLDQHAQLNHGDQEQKTVHTSVTGTESDKEMTSPKRRSEEYEGSPDVNNRSSDSQPLKKLKVNILKVHKCAVCGFNTENMTTFHEHIPRHKFDGSSYQCKECGLCYTSPCSLSRHLFIVHRVKEPRGLGHRQGRGDESQRENQLNSADENDDGTPNTRCKVCSREFETEGILNTHMRTHGMAFIKAKANREAMNTDQKQYSAHDINKTLV
ncbi:zinc finger protein 532 [Periophthalmus magnuspinnatus]|uniref:zinc finger protein 532 n=1 Tax=Periophthalmus magnuspinnatus TaxID=409849 RepID=UPI00145B1FC8|nr:zinc finger protein 532 [Periophthalmus magnuspinnatus]XP_055087797.1 zinc finger protein 532 [Periophthalmus magnuspinnatus]